MEKQTRSSLEQERIFRKLINGIEINWLLYNQSRIIYVMYSFVRLGQQKKTQWMKQSDCKNNYDWYKRLKDYNSEDANKCVW
jgi:hypothetical protein